MKSPELNEKEKALFVSEEAFVMLPQTRSRTGTPAHWCGDQRVYRFPTLACVRAYLIPVTSRAGCKYEKTISFPTTSGFHFLQLFELNAQALLRTMLL